MLHESSCALLRARSVPPPSSVSPPEPVSRVATVAVRPVSTCTVAVETGPVPEPGEGQIVARACWLSVDPYMRGRIAAGPSYARPVEPGEVMQGGGVGVVVASRLAGLVVGDEVADGLAWAGAPDEVLLIANDVLRPWYEAALARHGVEVRSASQDAAASGMWRVATARQR